jgi:hypothetical protein
VLPLWKDGFAVLAQGKHCSSALLVVMCLRDPRRSGQYRDRRTNQCFVMRVGRAG